MTSHSKETIPIYIITGYLCLIVASFLDNIRGPLIPIISESLQINYEKTSWFITAGNIAAGIGTFSLIKLLGSFSERRTLIMIGVVVTIALCSAFFVKDLPTFILLGVSVGSGVALFGTMSNILTIRGSSIEKRSNLLAGLHTMYGLGSMLGPLLVAYLLGQEFSWNFMFLIAIPLILTNIFLIGTFANEEGPTPQEKINTTHITWMHLAFILFMTLYINGELLASMWLVTFLNQTYHLTVEAGSNYIAGFFLCLTLSRLSTFLWFSENREKIFLGVSLIIPLTVFILGYTLNIPFLFSLVGFVGPFFPIMLAKISRKFPLQWQFMTIGIMVCQQLLGGLFHWLIGVLSDRVGIEAAYTIPAVLLFTTLLLLPFMYRQLSSAKA